MPPKRQAIGRYTPSTRKSRASRASETDEHREKRLTSARVRAAQARLSETHEQRKARLEALHVRTAQARSSETHEQRKARLEAARVRMAQARLSETNEQREARLKAVRVRSAQARSSETNEQRKARLEAVRVRTAQARSSETHEQRKARLEAFRVRTAHSRRPLYTDLGAFYYDANYDHSVHPSVVIGKITLPISSSKAIQDVTQLEPDMQISTKGEHSGVTKKSKANVDPHFFECQYNAADDGAVASTSRDFTNYDNFSSLEEEDDSYSDVPDFLPDLQPTPVDASVVKIEIEEEPLKIKNEPLIIENDPLTSDTYVEPTLPFIKEEPAEEPDQIALKNVDQLDESERQSIQMFFDSMARTVMNLSPSFVSRIKSEVLRVVSDIEMEANKKKMEQEPSRKTANVIAASDETEPRIEIKNENNEEAEASTKLDEPELLDPELLDLDHDANYEPLAKKKKIEQPSSSLQVHRTPRTLHEPVETFFQSIAYTVKSFPLPFVCKAKVAVLKVISKMEVEACRSHQSGYTDGGGGGDDSSRPDLLPSGSNY